jgi:hypothetical protein
MELAWGEPIMIIIIIIVIAIRKSWCVPGTRHQQIWLRTQVHAATHTSEADMEVAGRVEAAIFHMYGQHVAYTQI